MSEHSTEGGSPQTELFPTSSSEAPPCQDASTANTRGRGIDGERIGLYLEAVRLVRECRPGWAAFENVPGIRNSGRTKGAALGDPMEFAFLSAGRTFAVLCSKRHKLI